jgi:CMP/dCMP kinase
VAVITISRQVGSGSKEIASRLCEQLGYTFFDKRLMTQVATHVGLSASDIVDFSEDDYKVKGFFGRLFGWGTRRAVEPGAGLAEASPSEHLTVEQLDEPRSVEFVRSTVLAAYHRGNVVIIGRGGQALLRDVPDVLHVRLEAPEGTRIRRLMEQENCSFAHAYQLMVDRDRAAAQYLTEYFGIRWDDPMLYHLVINTGKLEPPAAAQVIVTALQAMQAVPVETLTGAHE